VDLVISRKAASVSQRKTRSDKSSGFNIRVSRLIYEESDGDIRKKGVFIRTLLHKLSKLCNITEKRALAFLWVPITGRLKPRRTIE